MIFECTLHTLWLLFRGYTIGMALGLITGTDDAEAIMDPAWSPVLNN